MKKLSLSDWEKFILVLIFLAVIFYLSSLLNLGGQKNSIQTQTPVLTSPTTIPKTQIPTPTTAVIKKSIPNPGGERFDN